MFILLSPFYAWRNWCSETFSNFPKVTQRISGRTDIWTQAVCHSSPLLQSVLCCLGYKEDLKHSQELFKRASWFFITLLNRCLWGFAHSCPVRLGFQTLHNKSLANCPVVNYWRASLLKGKVWIRLKSDSINSILLLMIVLPHFMSYFPLFSYLWSSFVVKGGEGNKDRIMFISHMRTLRLKSSSDLAQSHPLLHITLRESWVKGWQYFQVGVSAGPVLTYQWRVVSN